MGQVHRISDYSVYMNQSCKHWFLNETSKTQASASDESITEDFLHPEFCPIMNATIKMRNEKAVNINEVEMKRALQNVETAGNPALRRWLTEMQRRLHNPPTLDDGCHPSSMDVIVVSGCTQGINLSVEVLIEEGDAVLTEEYTFPCIFLSTNPVGGKIVTVKSDDEGMVPSHLAEILNNWNIQTDGKLPKIINCVPSGSNPLGITLSLARKQEIYRIAQKFDLLIMEDDPYYMIQFSKPRVPSFLSLDVDGRVIRLDSFSKILTAGARIGYISGPRQLLDRFVAEMNVSTESACCLVQMFILKILENLGQDGLIKHGEEVCELYYRNACIANQIAKHYLEGLAEWSVPQGGMFLWIRVPGVNDVSRILNRAAKNKVLFANGSCFSAHWNISNCLRVAFTLDSVEIYEKAFAILATAIKEEKATDSK